MKRDRRSKSATPATPPAAPPPPKPADETQTPAPVETPPEPAAPPAEPTKPPRFDMSAEGAFTIHDIVPATEQNQHLPTVLLRLPAVQPQDILSTRRRFDLRLAKPADARKLSRYLTAIVRSEVTLSNGRAVETASDAVKYLFEKMIETLPDVENSDLPKPVDS